MRLNHKKQECQLQQFIDKILSLGTSDERLSAYEKHSVRLINALCFFIALAKAVEDVFTFRLGNFSLILHSLIAHCSLLLVLFLNYKGKVLAGKITFTVICLAVLVSIPFTVPHSLNAEGLFLAFIVLFFSIYNSRAVILSITAFIVGLLLGWHIANHYGVLYPLASIDPTQVAYLEIVYSLMIIAILLITLYSSKKMTADYQKELSDNIEEKDMLIKEVHHRVKNNLQIIVSMLGIQQDGEHSPEALEIIKDVKARVVTMSLIHNKLYASKNFQHIEIGDYIGELFELLISMYSNNKTDIEQRISMDPLRMGLEFSIPLGLIVTEIISNSIKHAFVPGKRACISVSGTHVGEYFVLTIKDNGQGMDFANKRPDSLGFLLIDILCKQIQASVKRDNKEGLETTLTFLV